MAIAFQFPAQTMREGYPRIAYRSDCEYIDVQIMANYSSLEKHAPDYRTMSVGSIWNIDPETSSARMVPGNAWQASISIKVPNTPIFVDLCQLFARLNATA